MGGAIILFLIGTVDIFHLRIKTKGNKHATRTSRQGGKGQCVRMESQAWHQAVLALLRNLYGICRNCGLRARSHENTSTCRNQSSHRLWHVIDHFRDHSQRIFYNISKPFQSHGSFWMQRKTTRSSVSKLKSILVKSTNCNYSATLKTSNYKTKRNK